LRPYLVIPGVLVALAGAVFTLQGLGIVGPSSSFMFQSMTWIYDGLAVFGVGVAIMLVGAWMDRRRR